MTSAYLCVTDIFIHMYLLNYGNHFHFCSRHVLATFSTQETAHWVSGSECDDFMCVCALVPVVAAVEAAGRGSGLGLEGSAEGG